MSKILDKPAKKLFLVDLVHCSEIVDGVSPGAHDSFRPSPGGHDSSTSKTWQTRCADLVITFSMVTVQGVVVQTQDSGDTLYLDDGTSVAQVKGCNKIPFQSTKPIKGHYIMVVGQLFKTGTTPLIRAIKIQNLSHNVVMATIWPLEVIDELQQNGNVT